MMSEKSLRDFEGMKKIGNDRNLKILSTIFIDESGRVEVYSIDELQKENFRELLKFAISTIDYEKLSIS